LCPTNEDVFKTVEVMLCLSLQPGQIFKLCAFN